MENNFSLAESEKYNYLINKKIQMLLDHPKYIARL